MYVERGEGRMRGEGAGCPRLSGGLEREGGGYTVEGGGG